MAELGKYLSFYIALMSSIQVVSSTETERQRLLSAGRPTGYAAVAEEAGSKAGEKKHFNLVGLSAVDFWLLCLSIWGCSFLNAFDGVVVATLLGPISSSFNRTNLASWLGTSYLLSLCCFTPIYGRLSNIIGRRATTMVALAIFGVGNLCCAIAPSMELLIAARALAGVGGGGLPTMTSTISSDIIPIHLRGIFQGLLNIWFGLGTGLGASLGGIINDSIGWRASFGIQVPIIAVVMVAIFFKVRYELPEADTPGRLVEKQTPYQKFRRIDFLGCFLLAGWVGSALIAISLKTNSTAVDSYKWSDPIILGLFATSIVLFGLFLFVELKWAAEPVMPFELLHQQTPIAVAVNNFILSVMMFGALYSVPLFFSAVRQMTASQAGKHMISNSIMIIVGSLGTGYIVRTTQKYYWLTFGMGLITVATSIWLSSWDEETPDWQLWIGFAPMSFGFGGVTTTTIVGLIGDVGREYVAVATSLSYVFRTLGQVLGVALSGAILQAILQKELSARITGKGAEKIIASIRQSSASVAHLPDDLKHSAITSYQKALHGVFVCLVVCAAVGVLAGLGMKEVQFNSAGQINEDEVDEAERSREEL